MKLSEWNKSIEYAKQLCDNTGEKHNIEVRPVGVSSVDESRKTIHLQVFDAFGMYFKKYSTGYQDDLKSMVEALDAQITRIIREA